MLGHFGCAGSSDSGSAANDSGFDSSDVDAAVSLDAGGDGASEIDAVTGSPSVSWLSTLGDSVRLKQLAALPSGKSVALISYQQREPPPFKSGGRLVWFDSSGKQTSVTEVPVSPGHVTVGLALDDLGNAFVGYSHTELGDLDCKGPCFAIARQGVATTRKRPFQLADSLKFWPAIAADGKGGAYLGNREGDLDVAGEGPYLAVHLDNLGNIDWRLRAQPTLSDCGVNPCAGGAEGIAVDSASNAYVVGFDPYRQDVFAPYPTGFALHKVGPTGKVLWSKRARATRMSAVCHTLAVAVDAAGSPVVSGMFGGKLDLGDGKVLDAGEGDALFVARFSTAGSVTWQRALPGITRACLTSNVVGDRIFVGGWFEGKLTFGSDELVAAGDGSAFLGILGGAGAPLRGIVLGPYVPAFGALISGSSALVAGEYSSMAASILGKSAAFTAPGPNAFVARITLP